MKKNTVKIFALCIAAIMAMAAFASCGAEKTETGADIQQNNASLDGTVNTGAAKLTKAEAQEIAFKHFGVSAEECRITENEPDDDGNYEIEFICNGREYDIEVNAQSGAITEIDVENEDDDDKKKPAPSTPAPAKKLTAEEAKSLAFAHFGVKAENVRELEVELDDDGDYKIEFKAGGYEYEADVDAFNGNVHDTKVDRDDDYRNPSTEKKLTREEAKSLAFAHFGVKADNVRELEIELDDDGHYEIEFEVGNMEYSIDIALDGTVLESEKEYDDD